MLIISLLPLFNHVSPVGTESSLFDLAKRSAAHHKQEGSHLHLSDVNSMKMNPDAPKMIGISASKWTLVQFPVGVNAIWPKSRNGTGPIGTAGWGSHLLPPYSLTLIVRTKGFGIFMKMKMKSNNPSRTSRTSTDGLLCDCAVKCNVTACRTQMEEK